MRWKRMAATLHCIFADLQVQAEQDGELEWTLTSLTAPSSVPSSTQPVQTVPSPRFGPQLRRNP